MKKTIIAAVSLNNAIGKSSAPHGLPWRIKKDFEHFQKETKNKPLIVGDVTYKLMGEKPLPNRDVIILTFDQNYKPESVNVFDSFEKAFQYCESKNYDEVMIGGGTSIYKVAEQFADQKKITCVDKVVKDADAFYPEHDQSVWEGYVTDECKKCQFITYFRRR